MKDYKKAILDLKKNKAERIEAAFKLENIADEESIRAVAKAMFTDPSPIVRHECAFSLGETAAPKLAGPYLMKAIEEDESVFVRHEALMALGTLGDPSFIPFIEKFLNDPDPDITESAEIALQRLRETGMPTISMNAIPQQRKVVKLQEMQEKRQKEESGSP